MGHNPDSKRPWSERAREGIRGAKNPGWKGGVSQDRDHVRARTAAWIERPEVARQQLDHALRKRYGISVEEYEKFLEKQDGMCAICLSEPGRRRLDVDHSHDTGEVRGLLCELCNKALGGFNDDPDLLQRAIMYLKGGEAGAR